MKQRWMLRWIAPVIISVAIFRPVAGQTIRLYEPFVPTSEYSQALQLAEQTSTRGKAVETFLHLADQNPGTTLGAKCLFEAAAWTPNAAQSTQLYQRIIAQYPNSRFELHARMFLRDSAPQTSLDDWLRANDQLLQSLGAPTRADIHRSRSQAVAQLRALHPEYQIGLAQVYANLKGVLGGISTQRYSEALEISRFGQDAYFYIPEARDSFSNGIRWTTRQMNNLGAIDGTPTVDPRVAKLQPKAGQWTGPRPIIRFEAETGDFFTPQVDPSTARFLLDGQDVTKLFTMQSKLNPVARRDKIFQRFRFSYRPAQSLTAGQHSLSISVYAAGYQGSGPGATRLTVYFKVARDVHDDDRDDWDDDECP